VNDNKIPSSNEKEKSEIDKCKESPYYFYTNYVTVNGKLATTHLTEKEFNDIFACFGLDRLNYKPLTNL